MKVLIIENEIYLAQSIANKLSDSRLECVIAHSLKEVQKDNYDVILASFGTINEGYTELSKAYPQAIIILMIAYINDDTVIKPLRNGVTDYIVKPFIVDELIRKITHYKTYREVNEEIKFYRSYFSFIERELGTPEPFLYNPFIVDELIRKITHYKTYREVNEEIKFYRSYFSFIERELGTPEPFLYNPPFVIKTNTQRAADIYAMRYAREKHIHFQFYSLKEDTWKSIFRVPPKKNEIYYITNLEELKKSDRKDFLEMALKHNVIVSIVSSEKVAFPQVIDISRQSNSVELSGEILSVKEYEKIIITKYESRYPDIELAKKLGMSRKSLWEKRKKYGLSGEILSVKEYEKIIITKYESRYPDIELAKKLGMSRKSLWEKRKKYGIIRKNKTNP